MDEIKFELSNNILTIFINGKVTTVNANLVENEIENIKANNSFDKLVFDVEELEYISSAGLRVILKNLKSNPDLEIINASLEVYEIFDMTGFTDMATISKAYRKLSVEGLKVIGEGAKGIVYRYNDDTIVKAYKNPDALAMIQNERTLAKKAFIMGLPTAISYDVVKVDGKYGSVFELLDCDCMSHYIKNEPNNLPKYAKIFAKTLKDIHTIDATEKGIPDASIITDKWFDGLKNFVSIDKYNAVKKMYDEIPNNHNLLHMDFHTNNIMMQNDEVLLIDMDTLSNGNPIFELANTYVAYEGFRFLGDSMVSDFLGFSADLATDFYKDSLKYYFDKDDVTEESDKIALLGIIRIIRHVGRRLDSNPEYKDVMSVLLEKFDEYFNKVNNFII